MFIRFLVLTGLQYGLNGFVAGTRRVEQGLGAGCFQPFLRILLGKLQQRHAGPVALLLDLVACKNCFHHCGGIGSNLSSPFPEAFTVPLHILLMLWRHMLFRRTVLTATTMQADMRAYPAAIVEYLDRISGHADIDLAFDVFIWYGIILLIHGDVVIE